jgi:hypothetical protein
MSRRHDKEMQRLRASLLKELKKRESLKKDILDELKDKRKPSKFFGHPAVLLVLGFIFTSVLGASFSSYWQSREWHRQQSLQAKQRALEQKYQIANEVAQAIGEAYGPAAGVISAIQIEYTPLRQQELKEKVPVWRQARQQFLIKSSALVQKLGTHFPVDTTATYNDPKDARSHFLNIFYAIHRNYVELGNLLEELEEKKGEKGMEKDAINSKAKAILERMSNLRDVETVKLMEILAGDIKKDTDKYESEGLKSFWSYIFS